MINISDSEKNCMSWAAFCLHWNGVVEGRFSSENITFFFSFIMLGQHRGHKVSNLKEKSGETLTVFKSIVKTFLQILF